MKALISKTIFDPWQAVEAYQESMGKSGQYGGTAVFVGTMRDFNEGDEVTGMVLEHYPGMTEKYLEEISRQAEEKWPILDNLIVHRVGKMLPDEPIVVVAVWSAHRGDAFDACQFLIDELKSKAPLWKKETLKSGSRWVEHNT